MQLSLANVNKTKKNNEKNLKTKKYSKEETKDEKF